MFRHMCILAGCDYAPKEGEGTHIKGLGLKKAGQLLTEYRTPESVIDFWAGKKLVGGSTHLNFSCIALHTHTCMRVCRYIFHTQTRALICTFSVALLDYFPFWDINSKYYSPLLSSAIPVTLRLHVPHTRPNNHIIMAITFTIPITITITTVVFSLLLLGLMTSQLASRKPLKRQTVLFSTSSATVPPCRRWCHSTLTPATCPPLTFLTPAKWQKTVLPKRLRTVNLTQRRWKRLNPCRFRSKRRGNSTIWLATRVAGTAAAAVLRGRGTTRRKVRKDRLQNQNESLKLPRQALPNSLAKAKEPGQPRLTGRIRFCNR